MADRAVVLIGVARTGGDLPELQAVSQGLDAMKVWAAEQGIPDDMVLIFSDRDGSAVTAADIAAGIATLVEQRLALQQLVIYFAGHGINTGLSEYWLLTGAPGSANEAVNVAGTARLAERLPIPHIVIISDACRTLPRGLLAAGITGAVIVPNVTPSGPMSSVDIFYACLLGAPANEIADKNEAASVYRSLYTEVLVEALRGEYPQVVDAEAPAGSGEQGAFIRSHPLKRALPELTLDRLRELNAYLTVSQTPDAKVTSDELMWLSRVISPTGAGQGPSGDGPPTPPDGSGAGTRGSGGGSPVRGGLAYQVSTAVGSALSPPRSRRRGVGAPRPPAEFGAGASLLAEQFGPRHFETGVGVKVRGAGVVNARSVGGSVELLDEHLVRVTPDNPSSDVTLAAHVVVEMDAGAVLLPTLNGYFTVVTVWHEGVADIAFEPMEWTELGRRWERHQTAFQGVRSQLVMAMDMGVDPVERDRTESLARWAEDNVDLDLSVAMVAAWQLRDSGRRDLVRRLHDRVVEVYGSAPVDLELAADLPVPGLAQPPGLPLLNRSWAIYDLIADPHPARSLSRRRLPSTWSLYRHDAADQLFEAALLKPGTASRPDQALTGSSTSRKAGQKMRTLVLVHGRSQQFKNADDLKSEWVTALHRGLSLAGIDDEIPGDRIRFPYYGQTLHDLVEGNPDDAAKVIVRGDGPTDDNEAQFVFEVLQEMADEAEISDQDVRQALDDPTIERGPLNWSWVRALAQLLDQRLPGAGPATVALTTRDVHRYLTNPGVARVIDQGLVGAMPPEEAVVVAHSLGTIVAYNVLRRGGHGNGWQVPLLVTAGSPLGVRAISRRLRPISRPQSVRSWFNAYDPQDIVSLHPLDETYFPVEPAIENYGHVDNTTSNQHGISGYLSDPIVAQRIHAALTA